MTAWASARDLDILAGRSEVAMNVRLDALRQKIAGAGDAGDADGDIGVRAAQRAFRHFARGRFADGAMGDQRRLGDAEQLLLGGVGIGDEAAF